MLYREAGQFKETYRQDQAIFPIVQDRVCVIALLVVAYVVVPLVANEYWLQAILIPFLISSLAALGLNLLTGYAGQVSLGTGGFMAVGAYSAYKMTTAFPELNILLIFLLVGTRGGGYWPGLRHTESAHQRTVSGGGHPGGAILPHVALQPCGVVLQLQPFRHDYGPASDIPGPHGDRS